MSKAARLMMGIILITVPTIVFGGLTLLGILSGGSYGAPAPQGLSTLQYALYRAGHAHAGVLVLLALILQLALDHVRFGSATVWFLRILAPVAAILVSAGFFGTAHFTVMRFVLYLGALSVILVTFLTGLGLVLRKVA